MQVGIAGICLLLSITHKDLVHGLPKSILIGGLFDESDTTQELAFRYAIQQVNNDPKVLPRTRLEAAVERLPQHDSFYASKRVCQMFRNGVAAILGPTSVTTATHIQSLCEAFEIPHIETRWESSTQRAEYSVNLQPHPSSLSKAYWDVIRGWGWRSFTILYEDEEGLFRLQDLLQVSTLPAYKVVIRQLTTGDDYRPLLKEMKKMGERNVVLDCTVAKIQPILFQAKQVGLATAAHSFFISNLDLHTTNLEDLKHNGVNITGLRMVDPNQAYASEVVEKWVYGETKYGRTVDVSEDTLQTEAALTYDAVQLFARALHELDREKEVTVKSMSCDGSDTWLYGSSLINTMKQISNQITRDWLTGPVKFDEQGLRTHFHLSIIEFHRAKFSVVGTWDSVQGANFSRLHSGIHGQVRENLQNMTFTVTSKLSDPYFMMKESSVPLVGNDRYEGFVMDIIHEISEILGFKYVFKLVDDSNYGSLDAETGEWNGMIRELLDGKADLAIGDFSISYEREQAVDFTMPFMNTGISILYKKPQKKPPGLFSFLSPLSVEVWIYMCTAYLGVSLLLFLLARVTPYEWNNPHPCHQNPDILENQFTILNSMWFTIGSLMQQGSDVAPKAMSTRMIAGIWWFFTLIMISSYTANLAAFLTVDRMESPIESAEDLAKQTKIKYGSVRSGSTLSFFRESQIATYQRMFTFMESTRPSVFTKSTMECVQRVQRSNGQYACLMESSSIEFFVERRCDLTRVGSLIDSKGYGIAMRRGSFYLGELSQAVLKLQETNRLLILKDKWWKERGGGVCKEEGSKSSTSTNELGLANVGGVFVVLIGGVVIALFISICEFAWKSRKLALEEREGNVWKEMLRELRHALNCSGNTKPVRQKNRDYN